MKGKGEAKSRVRRPTRPSHPTAQAERRPIAPGQGIIVVELTQGELAAIDLAAFIDALQGEVVAFQDQTQFLSTDTWREMESAALRKTLSEGEQA